MIHTVYNPGTNGARLLVFFRHVSHPVKNETNLVETHTWATHMERPAYYFVNHTRQQVCYFEHEMSILRSLNKVLQTLTNWKLSDDIFVDHIVTGSMPHWFGYKELYVDYEEQEQDTIDSP